MSSLNVRTTYHIYYFTFKLYFFVVTTTQQLNPSRISGLMVRTTTITTTQQSNPSHISGLMVRATTITTTHQSNPSHISGLMVRATTITTTHQSDPSRISGLMAVINQIWNPEVFRSKGFNFFPSAVVFAKTYFTFLPLRAANRLIYSECFNHCLTKQMEYSWKRQAKGIIYLGSVLNINNIRCN